MGRGQIQITDDLEALLEVLPPAIRAALEQQADLDQLLEVVLDLGRLPEARFPGAVVYLSGTPTTREEIRHVTSRVGAFGKDNRAGIERTLHRISAIRNRQGEIIGLTCRVGRAVFGTVDIVRDVIEQGKSILLLGRPGVGKTTLLREAARVLADEFKKRVVIVDTSNEIAGDGDIPHPGIGGARRMQVPEPSLQHAVMIEAVENHMPEVIVIDEIGTEAEALAARTIAERGVQLIATAHGNTLDNLLQNPTLADLIGGIQAVTLSDEEARRRGTQKTVLERKAPPTFDVIIEIQEKDRLAVHHDVAAVVDRFLRGAPPRPELRVRTEGGEVEITRPTLRAETWAPAGPLAPATDGTRPGGRVLRIYPFAVSRNRLERAIRELRVPAYITDTLADADMVLSIRSQEKRRPKKLADAQARGIPLHVIKSNTVSQIQAFLREVFDVEEYMGEETAALREVEEAIAEVFESAQPVELSPQNSYVRRLQHQLIQRYGLASESRGEEPLRRVVIFPK
ncbi:MAG: R3H domain-containing nucleic acid-binding protein [Armatimonadota bacterium]|nr:R3H domain-containing nucleic acid-binding protein [Armatimonadota bacterium]MDR7426710.1 R3H domain-containing nucleic acid-binding protein [Armatimonadota bacterium]MDR7463738.1 R3H domain-containing nucleic acid-binding protein [Armatimonadota bacterium]MDR7469261.1 R3H domain-containing nucleic acid-binding protein [Armatimonadota bacterium]MDR7475119.1 R3H domain-containing nucleic acid-binding protein [Armatimonadota bacterium]